MTVSSAVASPDADDSPEEVQPVYSSVEEWVLAVFTTTFVRSRARWCSSWWKHCEAIVGLTALWQSWEIAQLGDGGALVDWLTRDLYPIHRELCSDEGPFAACNLERHSDVDAWPVDPAPPGYWPTAA